MYRKCNKTHYFVAHVDMEKIILHYYTSIQFTLISISCVLLLYHHYNYIMCKYLVSVLVFRSHNIVLRLCCSSLQTLITPINIVIITICDIIVNKVHCNKIHETWYWLKRSTLGCYKSSNTCSRAVEQSWRSNS